MSDTTNEESIDETAGDAEGGAPQTEEERNAAYKEAAWELGEALLLGAVPILGQVIDAYDTIESAITLYQAKKADDKENAQFDFLLALVGWIPGPGDGVKKSLRIVNSDPQRFAPVLFDLLRYVLQKCGVETSPEALLDEIFNADKLRAQIAEIKKGVQDSDTFKALPQTMQTAVIGTLATAEANMPALVGVVEKRLKKWKRMQRNSSSRGATNGRAKEPPPKAKDGQVAKQGENRPVHSGANDSANGTLATQPLDAITQEMVGISGEHIADYICAFDGKFQWGTDWKAHDDGSGGTWTQGKPGKDKAGKLSKGGAPKAAHVLYKLSDGANGTGIDAVWKADKNNGGKPYAIVEAKATRNEDAPKFLRKANNTRKPSVVSTLGNNVITDLVELIEPLEEDDKKAGASAKTSTTSSRKKGKTKKGAASGSTKATTDKRQGKADGKKNKVKEVLVQMSHDWIIENIKRAVPDAIADDIRVKRQKSYSRHLFYCPAYHTSGSPKDHMLAKANNSPPSAHTNHDGFHYNDNEVKIAVNKRKASLRKKYGDLDSLKAE